MNSKLHNFILFSKNSCMTMRELAENTNNPKVSKFLETYIGNREPIPMKNGKFFNNTIGSWLEICPDLFSTEKSRDILKLDKQIHFKKEQRKEYRKILLKDIEDNTSILYIVRCLGDCL